MNPRSDGVKGAAQTTQLDKGPRRAALGFIFAAALMDILALGLIIPVLPNLVKHFARGDTAEAARYVGWFGLIFGAMQFIFSPILGALSDRFGRRPVLLISIFGLGFDYILMALAPSIGWLFLGRTLSGITAASFSTASAYVADISPPDQRAKNFGFMGAAFGVGFVIGPAAGGFLGGIDLRLPFWVAGGLALVNGLYGLFVLPESLPRAQRATFSLAKANPLGSLRLLRSHPELLGLASVVFLYFLAHQVLQSTFVLYTGYRYAWGPSMVGYNLMGVGVGNILVQAFVVGPFVKRFGGRARVFDLRSGADGHAVLARAARLRAHGAGPAGVSRPDEPARGAERARATSGRQFWTDGHWRYCRADPLHESVRVVDQRAAGRFGPGHRRLSGLHHSRDGADLRSDRRPDRARPRVERACDSRVARGRAPVAQMRRAAHDASAPANGV